jgi:hypothetical protein
MDGETRKQFGTEFNREVGALLTSLRCKAGLSLDRVAELIAMKRLEKLKRLEDGSESLHGLDLIELVKLYGADPSEAQVSIQAIAVSVRRKFQVNGPAPDPQKAQVSEPPQSTL